VVLGHLSRAPPTDLVPSIANGLFKFFPSPEAAGLPFGLGLRFERCPVALAGSFFNPQLITIPIGWFILLIFEAEAGIGCFEVIAEIAIVAFKIAVPLNRFHRSFGNMAIGPHSTVYNRLFNGGAFFLTRLEPGPAALRPFADAPVNIYSA